MIGSEKRSDIDRKECMEVFRDWVKKADKRMY